MRPERLATVNLVPLESGRLRRGGRARSFLTPKQFHYEFTDTMSREESQAIYEHYHVPGRVLFQAATPNLSPHAATKVDFERESRPRCWLWSEARSTPFRPHWPKRLPRVRARPSRSLSIKSIPAARTAQAWKVNLCNSVIPCTSSRGPWGLPKKGRWLLSETYPLFGYGRSCGHDAPGANRPGAGSGPW